MNTQDIDQLLEIQQLLVELETGYMDINGQLCCASCMNIYKRRGKWHQPNCKLYKILDSLNEKFGKCRRKIC